MVFNRKEIIEKKDRIEIYGMLGVFILYLFFLGFAEYSLVYQIAFYAYLIIILVFIFKLFKNHFYNIKRFILLLFLLIIIFPLTHDILFRLTKNNYAFNADYLNHKKREISNSLLDYNDTNELHLISKTLPSNILNLVFKDNLIGKRYYYINGFVLIAPELIGSDARDIDRRTNYNIEFYNLKSKKIGLVKIKNETIIEGIYSKINKRIALEKELKKPETNIHFSDIWIDSITVFVFSNIKPIGRFTQIIQLFQVLTSFIFIFMMTSFLDNFKQLKITKKE